MDGTGPDFEALPPYDGTIPAYLPAPPPAGPAAGRRGWIGPTIGAGAVILAAGAFLLGHATAGKSAAPATAAFATTAASASPDSASLVDAMGVVDPAAAATPDAHCAARGGVAGTLKSVSGSTLTVTNRQGQDVTVKSDANTTVTKVTTGGVGDVAKDATVAVRGTGSGTTISADKVAILPSGLAKPLMPAHKPAGSEAGHGAAIGTVQSVSGSGFTLKLADGTTITVTTSSATTFSQSVVARIGDLTVGQPVAAAGTPNADGSITAASVVQRPAGVPGFGGPGGFGRFGQRGAKPGPGSTPSTTTP